MLKGEKLNPESTMLESKRHFSQYLVTSVLDVVTKICVLCKLTTSTEVGIKKEKSIGLHFYKLILRRVIEGSKEYQILCANCNWVKRVERGESRKWI